MRNPLVSVIVLVGPYTPTRGEKLIKCIQSVRTSSYRDFEIIVVDNSRYLPLKDKLSKMFPEVRVLQMPTNTGIFGYNVGFANARGEYLLALDDDCTIEKDTLKKITDLFKASPKDLGVICTNVYNPVTKNYIFSHYIRLSLQNIYIFAGGASAFRREIFYTVGFYDPDFFCWVHEDDLAVRILDAGYKIHFAQDIVINHHEERGVDVRRKRAFFTFRNRAWFNLKNISWRYLPIFIVKDWLWFFLFSFKGSFRALFWAILGYAWGYFSFITPLRKRRAVSGEIQKNYLKYFLTFWRQQSLIKKGVS